MRVCSYIDPKRVVRGLVQQFPTRSSTFRRHSVFIYINALLIYIYPPHTSPLLPHTIAATPIADHHHHHTTLQWAKNCTISSCCCSDLKSSSYFVRKSAKVIIISGYFRVQYYTTHFVRYTKNKNLHPQKKNYT